MHAQGTGSAPSGPDRGVEAVEHEVLMTLLVEFSEQQVWAREELEREFAERALDFPTALQGLRRAGIVNVCGDLVFVSRAARRTEEITSEA